MAGTNQADEALLRLLRELGHELASPLGSILISSELLAETVAPSLDERRARSLRSIAVAALEAQRLVRHTVEIARASFGELALETHRFSPEEMLDNNVSGHFPNVRMTTAPDTPGQISGHRPYVQQAVELLLAHASRMDPHPILELLQEAPGTVSFAVRHADGRRAAQPGRALDPFGPGGLQGARAAAGGELEVTLSDQLARRLGGSVTVAREEGFLTWTLRLPIEGPAA